MESLDDFLRMHTRGNPSTTSRSEVPRSLMDIIQPPLDYPELARYRNDMSLLDKFPLAYEGNEEAYGKAYVAEMDMLHNDFMRPPEELQGLMKTSFNDLHDVANRVRLFEEQVPEEWRGPVINRSGATFPIHRFTTGEPYEDNSKKPPMDRQAPDSPLTKFIYSIMRERNRPFWGGV